MSDSEAALATIVDRRIAGDRTGMCLAVAVITKGEVVQHFSCTDPAHIARLNEDSAFEIGSITKTMTAALLADLDAAGVLTLSDPVSRFLPDGVEVPEYDGESITLAHLVTHTSGLPALPSRMVIQDPGNPYAALTEGDLLASLSDVELMHPPGSQFQYSNFGWMILSFIVTSLIEDDFETILTERMLVPLGMDNSYVSSRPENVRAVAGHLPSRQPTGPWDFPARLAGVGGVRANLADMVRYTQAHLGVVDAPIVQAMHATHDPIAGSGLPMSWFLTKIGDRTIHFHEGGTGGFSSLVAFDKEASIGVVVLSDTALSSVGGLAADLGFHLIDERSPLGTPRRTIQPPPELLNALEGEFELDNSLRMVLTSRGERLFIDVPGQAEFEMGFDSAGDFFPLAFDAILRPVVSSDDQATFIWHQGGAAMAADRVTKVDRSAVATPTPKGEYDGVYALAPQFALAITSSENAIYVQGTGQSRLRLIERSNDLFTIEGVVAEIEFERRGDGAVVALILRQHGQTLRGQREATSDRRRRR